MGLKADEVLKKDIDLQTTGSDAAAEEAADNYASAFAMIAVILGASLVIGIGVSFYLVRDVSSGIASIVEPMQALGRGDLTAQGAASG